MITLEEKLKLFEDIGMTGMVRKIKEEKEMKEEAEKLTAMKFKITDEDKIRKMICGKYWAPSLFIDGGPPWPSLFIDGGPPWPIVILLISLLGSVVLGVLGCTPEHSESVTFPIAGTSIVFIGTCLLMVCSWRKTSRLQSTQLEDWTDKIPTGALYAVKEAKEKGLGDFRIYFPITEKKDRLMTDPVIVGFYPQKKSKENKIISDVSDSFYQQIMNVNLFGRSFAPKGKMIEIFAWDDGKVYE